MKVKSTRRPEAPTAETWPLIRDAMPPRDQRMFQASPKTARGSPTDRTKIALWFQLGGVLPFANQKSADILGVRSTEYYCYGLHMPRTPEHLIIPYAGEDLFAVRVSSRSRTEDY